MGRVLPEFASIHIHYLRLSEDSELGLLEDRKSISVPFTHIDADCSETLNLGELVMKSERGWM
jgi:hypothetical protein